MSDLGVYCGGSAGPAWLRHPEEFTDYETGYAATDIVCGLEYANIAWGWGQFSLLTDIRYSLLRGSDVNRGSHRQAISADMGLRTRLRMLVLEASAGGGYARTAFDFGKGFPVSTVDAAAVQLHVNIGLDLCWGGGTLCLTPYVEYAHERGVAGERYELPMLRGGLRFGASSAAPLRTPVQEQPLRNGTMVPHEMSAAVQCAEPRSPEPERLHPRPAHPEPTPTASPGTPQTLVQVVFLKNILKFPNDNPDLDLRTQRFARQDRSAAACLSNPDLDDYIRAVWRWTTAIKEGRLGLAGHITFVLHVYGYANDTGDLDQQRYLADARSANVVAYLTRSCGAQDAYGRNHALPPLMHERYVRVIDENTQRIRTPIQAIREDFGRDVTTTDPRFRMARVELDIVVDGVVLPTRDAMDLIHLLEKQS